MAGRSKPVEFTTRRFEKQGDTEGKVTCAKTEERIKKEREGLLNLDKSISFLICATEAIREKRQMSQILKSQ